MRYKWEFGSEHNYCLIAKTMPPRPCGDQKKSEKWIKEFNTRLSQYNKMFEKLKERWRKRKEA